MAIAPALVGSDHWSVFAYIETLCVDRGGAPDLRRMRCNGDLHPGLDNGQNGKKYPTRLKGGSEIEGHDDWSCADDLETAGLVEIMGTGIAPVFVLTDKGRRVAARVRAHLAAGNRLGAFEMGTE